MISICIPIYNVDVTALVTELSSQIEQLEVPAELILIDDCSNLAFLMANEEVCKAKNYIKLKKNIGRSAIRNRFLVYAKYKYLLFLDCDALIPAKDFLQKYIEEVNNSSAQVICGGRVYPIERPERNRLLRWKYGTIKESQSYLERNKRPNQSFMTNNFLIQKNIFESIKFEERLVEYGHEDTLFGFELKIKNIQITHIDNSILNGDFEKNKQFLIQTEKGIKNLVQILEYKNFDNSFIEDVTLLRTYYKYYSVRKVIKGTFQMLEPGIKYFLDKGYVSLRLFDFYKLGTLAVNIDKLKRHHK